MATAIQKNPIENMMKFTETADNSEIIECSKHSGILLNGMLSLLNSRELCDVVLISGVEKRLPAHRVVLAATSQYFRAMFTGSMRESKENEIHLQEVESDVLEKLVQFCYTGKIELRDNNVESILSSANLFRFESVMTACSEFLIRHLQPSNCLGMSNLAKHYSLNELQTNAELYLYDNFTEVCKTEEFINLTANELRKILAEDDIIVDSEETIFKSLMSWIEYDKENREKLLDEFLSDSVRLWQLEPYFISKYVKPLCKTTESKQLVSDAMKWHMFPEERLDNDRYKARKTNESLIAILSESSGIHLHRYVATMNIWNLFSYHFRLKAIEFGVAVSGSKVFIVGPPEEGHMTNTLHCMDTKTDDITELSCMRTKRESMGVAVLDGLLYAVGGHLNTVERWDPQTNLWSCVSPMLQHRDAPRVVVFDELLYALGGHINGEWVESVECYDPCSNAWNFKAPMNIKTGNFGVAVLKGFIYVVDGQTKIVERYNTTTNTWSSVCSLSDSIQKVKCTSIGGRIIAAGTCGNVKEYDPSSNQWKSLDKIVDDSYAALISLVKLKTYKADIY